MYWSWMDHPISDLNLVTDSACIFFSLLYLKFNLLLTKWNLSFRFSFTFASIHTYIPVNSFTFLLLNLSLIFAPPFLQILPSLRTDNLSYIQTTFWCVLYFFFSDLVWSMFLGRGHSLKLDMKSETASLLESETIEKSFRNLLSVHFCSQMACKYKIHNYMSF